MEETRKLLTAGPMARRLHVKVRWLKGEADSGRLPHLKADSIYLFDPETVETAILKRAREGAGHD